MGFVWRFRDFDCAVQGLSPISNMSIFLLPSLPTSSELLRYKVNMYKLKEEREIQPKTFAHLVSATLYEKRFGPYYAEPIIAGLEKDGTPFICSTDLIGCTTFPNDFVVTGSASQQLFGMCESLWEPNLVMRDKGENREGTWRGSRGGQLISHFHLLIGTRGLV